MKLIDLPTCAFGRDLRARNVTRPIMTTALFLVMAVMIVLDIIRRRRSARARSVAA